MKISPSATPLARKLGIKEGFVILVLNPPKDYKEFFTEFPERVTIKESSENTDLDFIHLFVRTFEELEESFLSAKPSLKKNGTLWISWPKKSSEIKTALDQHVIMNYGLNNGLVDVKIASVDKDWSGHKFVYRLKDR